MSDIDSYLLEHETMGTYINDRERFDKDWDNGNYYPDGSLSFSKDEVEIIGNLGKKWTNSEERKKEVYHY